MENELFELTQTGEIDRFCTADYVATLLKEFTVNDFVLWLLKQSNKECTYGTIYLQSVRAGYSSRSILAKYESGRFVEDNGVLYAQNANVIYMETHGGYGLMDFTILVP